MRKLSILVRKLEAAVSPPTASNGVVTQDCSQHKTAPPSQQTPHVLGAQPIQPWQLQTFSQTLGTTKKELDSRQEWVVDYMRCEQPKQGKALKIHVTTM
jgi:hypothetical protein